MTVVCLASGPSLTQTDVDKCRPYYVIAVKDAVRLAPWANVLYACDAKWWKAHPETESFAGEKIGMEVIRGRQDVTIVRNTGQTGLELEPGGLRTGQNSGYQAINLAVQRGATKVVLLGYDMQAGQKGRMHFFGHHPYRKPNEPLPFAFFKSLFPSMVLPLKALGVQVYNATPASALTCFPRVSLEEALAA